MAQSGRQGERTLDTRSALTPGLVLGAAGAAGVARGACRIRCGQGTALEVLSLRAEGRSAISGDEAMRGRLLVPGEVLRGRDPAGP